MPVGEVGGKDAGNEPKDRPSDPNLSAVIDAWPSLPDTIRAGIGRSLLTCSRRNAFCAALLAICLWATAADSAFTQPWDTPVANNWVLSVTSNVPR